VGDLTGWFVNPGVCDLRLTEKGKAALKAGAPLEEVPADVNGKPAAPLRRK